MANSRIRIQLPKLDTLDANGLIPKQHHADDQSNGIASDTELGGEEDTCSPVPVLEDDLLSESVVYSDYLTGRSMPDFVGVNGLEKNLVDAIMNFSYYLTLGDLDAAFKAIKTVKK